MELTKRFYDRGVGADGNKLQRILGGASGSCLDNNILDGYQYLTENHEEGTRSFSSDSAGVPTPSGTWWAWSAIAGCCIRNT